MALNFSFNAKFDKTNDKLLVNRGLSIVRGRKAAF